MISFEEYLRKKKITPAKFQKLTHYEQEHLKKIYQSYYDETLENLNPETNRKD